MPGRHSCKQLLQALVGGLAGPDNAVMASHFPLLLLASAALAGCAVVPGPVDYGPVYGPAYPTTIYAAPPAPPAPRIEYPGLPPAVGYVWIDGYWNWGGSRYLWVPGRWSAPHPRQAWGPEFWPREPRRPPPQRWEERRPPPRPHFEQPDRDWRNEPRAPRPEPPRSQVQPAPPRPAPPVIQQTEPGRAGFMRGLAERAQAERPESGPRSAEPGSRRPPETGRRDERGRPVPGEGGERH